MSFLSFLFRRQPSDNKAATFQAAPQAAASSETPNHPAAAAGHLHLIPAERRRRQPRQPESEGALAISPLSDDVAKRRRRRRRGGRGRSTAVAAAAAPTREPLLFPLPSTPGLFSDNPAIERAVAEAGWQQPTPIQERSLPVLRGGGDLVGQAQTGSGKTGAFGIPVIERLNPDMHAVQALIVVPTRELAEQVTTELSRMAKYAGLKALAVYGGVGYEHQMQGFRRGDQIVVGTPGRIIDHLERGSLDFSDVRMVVLDEADRMLDMGFQPDVERILRRTPRDRQTALFSATIPVEIHDLIYKHLRDPEWIRIEMEIPTVDSVKQVYYEVAERDKFDGLLELLDMNDWPSVLIFRHTQRGVDRIEGLLRRKGYSVAGIHGGMSQAVRQSSLNQFSAGRVRILIATNVASRGLDIPDVSHVVNYDMPEDLDTYVHRVGRTARMGKQGTAVTFVAEGDLDMFDQLQSRLKDQLRPERLALYG
ncbi:MAG TPA: DEAD/DEAH box helicase [Chloroflexota bacterium]|nr:DEAD/DEAH box helicase [Chloroflexota bacterium]